MEKNLLTMLVSLLLIFNMSPFHIAAASLPELHTKATEMKEVNSDAIGWLQIPGTDIDEVVLFRNDADDLNTYYFRRNMKKEYSFEGCYFADYRCTFPPDKLRKNTVIYGHSFSNDPDGKRFNQLYRYLDKQFASENPIIFFSSVEETMAYQVFAISFMTTADPYNVPSLQNEARMEVVEKVRKKSVHDYSYISVSDKSQILTLSTQDWSKPYPNDSRLVIMAKKVKLTDK